MSPEYIAGLVDGEGCFDLQFRRDVRTERPGAPVYFGWKAQFVINMREDEEELLKKIRDVFQCGTIHFSNGHVRYSIQDSPKLHDIIVPFFVRHRMHGKKQKDFELWARAVDLLYHHNNRSKGITNIKNGKRGFQKIPWSKYEFACLVQLHADMQKYKAKRKSAAKWMSQAECVMRTLAE